MELKYTKVCRIRCRHCSTVLEWVNRSKEDNGSGRVMMCKCGKVGLDPSASLYRILGYQEDWDNLSIPWDEAEKRKRTGIMASNGMMYVGDQVRYDEGYFCFTKRIVEKNGKFGFLIFDGEFHEIMDVIADPELEDFGLDFEILGEEEA